MKPCNALSDLIDKAEMGAKAIPNEEYRLAVEAVMAIGIAAVLKTLSVMAVHIVTGRSHFYNVKVTGGIEVLGLGSTSQATARDNAIASMKRLGYALEAKAWAKEGYPARAGKLCP